MPKPEEIEAAIADLAGHAVAAEDIARANSLAGACYWQDRDPGACHRILRAALDAGREALGKAPPAAAEALRAEILRLSYNFAACGWVGWDEPGMAISPEFQRDAVEAGIEHFALAASEIEHDALHLSRARWIAGAVLVQAGDLGTAREHFERAAKLARDAGKEGEAMNADAFVLVCDALAGVEGADAKLDAHLERMRATPGASDFAPQAPTALRVYRARAAG